MNIGVFIGRIGRDATIRGEGNNTALGFPVAVDVGYGDKKSTLWLDCTLWGERGLKLADYITKGDRIGVTGEVGTRTYDKDGETKTSVTLRVSDVTLLGEKKSKDEAAPAPRRETSRPAPRQAAPAQSDGFEDDEIPFLR